MPRPGPSYRLGAALPGCRAVTSARLGGSAWAEQRPKPSLRESISIKPKSEGGQVRETGSRESRALRLEATGRVQAMGYRNAGTRPG